VLRHLLGLTAVVLLSACSPGAAPPIQAGEAIRYDGGRIAERWQLTPEERFNVRTWLEVHGSGWTLSAADYAPGLLVLLQYEDGSLASLNIHSSFVVQVRGRWEYTKDFATRDIEALRQALTAGTTANNRWRGP
jgi:hypothetical protein